MVGSERQTRQWERARNAKSKQRELDRDDDGDRRKPCRGSCGGLFPRDEFPPRSDGRGPGPYCGPCLAQIKRRSKLKCALQRGIRAHVEVPAGFKACRGPCGQIKPVNDFARGTPSHPGIDGYGPRCVDCVNRQKCGQVGRWPSVETPVGFKACRGACGQIKPVNDFRRGRPAHRGIDGYNPRCRACIKRQKSETPAGG